MTAGRILKRKYDGERRGILEWLLNESERERKRQVSIYFILGGVNFSKKWQVGLTLSEGGTSRSQYSPNTGIFLIWKPTLVGGSTKRFLLESLFTPKMYMVSGPVSEDAEIILKGKGEGGGGRRNGMYLINIPSYPWDRLGVVQNGA